MAAIVVAGAGRISIVLLETGGCAQRQSRGQECKWWT